MFGGPVPDAITALVRLLATMHDDTGNVAVAGPQGGCGRRPRLRRGATACRVRAADGVDLIGSGSILSRDLDQAVDHDHRHRRPTVATSSNTLVPTASAKISMRLAPDEFDLDGFEALKKHLLDHAPVGRGSRSTSTIGATASRRTPRAGL